MRIGIVTFHASNNYGANLQAFALQTHLRKVGHDPFFINYHRQNDAPPGWRPRDWLARTPRDIRLKLIARCHYPAIRRFKERCLNIVGDPIFRPGEVATHPPQAEAYLCGSDQIWNPDLVRRNEDGIYWLDFAPPGVPRVAYAGSFGVPSLEKDLIQKWGIFARGFRALGVREKEGLGLMASLGRMDGAWVPDPTMLLEAGEYGHLLSKRTSTNPRHLFSHIIIEGEVFAREVVRELLGSIGKGCREIRPWSLRHFLRYGPCGPEDWLDWLSRAEFVVTNSFHALVFSLIFHRPFIVLLRPDEVSAKNGRALSLLDSLGLAHRALADRDRSVIEKIRREGIDWERVDSGIRKMREKGIRFLKMALPETGLESLSG